MGHGLNQYLENVQTSIDKPVTELTYQHTGSSSSRPLTCTRGSGSASVSGATDDVFDASDEKRIDSQRIKKEEVKMLLARRIEYSGA